MNCPKCNALNESYAKFCRNCGTDLTAASGQGSNKDLMYVLLFLSWEYFIYVGWFIAQKVIVPMLAGNAHTRSYDVYEIVGWTDDILSIIILIIFTTLVRNKTAKILFIVCMIIRIIMLIGYRILT